MAQLNEPIIETWITSSQKRIFSNDRRQESLEKLARGRTTFTIAHRLTTIRNADRILVLTENGIEESGTHAELIEKGGLYSELYKLYSEL